MPHHNVDVLYIDGMLVSYSPVDSGRSNADGIFNRWNGSKIRFQLRRPKRFLLFHVQRSDYRLRLHYAFGVELRFTGPNPHCLRCRNNKHMWNLRLVVFLICCLSESRPRRKQCQFLRFCSQRCGYTNLYPVLIQCTCYVLRNVQFGFQWWQQYLSSWT